MTPQTFLGKFLMAPKALCAVSAVCLLLAGCGAAEPEAKKPTADQLQQNRQVMKRQREDR